MSEKKESKLMYSSKDIELIKSVFAENDELMLAIRKLFFGTPVSEEEKKAITEAFASQEVRDVFQRKVYGLNNFDTPIGQLSDFWLGAETQVFGASRDAIYQTVESKKLILGMFQKAFKLLENPDGEKVDITTFPDIDVDELQIGLIARNLYMKAIETSLLTIKAIAGVKGETMEQTLKRLEADSSK